MEKKPVKSSGKLGGLAARELRQGSKGKPKLMTDEEARRRAGSTLNQNSREKARSTQTIEKIAKRHERVLKRLADK